MSNPRISGLPGYETQAFLGLDIGLSPGMSGGPIITIAGDVVGLIQFTDPMGHLAFGRRISVLYDATKPYWE